MDPQTFLGDGSDDDEGLDVTRTPDMEKIKGTRDGNDIVNFEVKGSNGVASEDESQ